jgi:predicted site-specific integrase-resolvase
MNGPERDPLLGIYLSAGDLADLLHVSPKTITRWARDGKLPVDSRTLVGAHLRFQARAIVTLLAKLDQPVMSDEEFVFWYARRHPTKQPRGRR